ncbi:MAG: hypothetical protein HY266_07700 [Deltaproteobacteria bacterium]|nr:hypothetical protein [Deltaproteobacteria bacterium]
MHRHLGIFIGFIMVVLLIKLAIAEQVGLMPVPIFTYAKVESQVAYDSATGLYTYSYTITNPATNTGEIIHIDIDITRPSNSVTLSSEGLTIPIGKKIKTFDEVIAMTNNPKLSLSLVPVGELVPSGWTGGLAQFGSKTGGDRITPGETQSGFEIISRGLPSIREIELVPKWVLLVESEEMVTQEEKQLASQIEDFLPYKTKTIAPTAPPSSFDPSAFFETLKSYLNESVTLGWLIDPTLTTTLKTYLDTTGAYIGANDPSKAKAELQQFMATIEQASSSQMATEAYGLLYFNAKYLKDWLPDTYIPPVLKLNLTPSEVTLTIGIVHTVTAAYTEDNIPMPLSPSCQVTLKVTTGPNAGLTFTAPTDANGNAIFSYTSVLVGTDQLEAEIPEIPDLCTGVTSLPAHVVWTGGPDLIIPLFFPPLIKKSEGEKTIFVKDATSNIGSTPSASSITRYFLSDTEPIDLATALDIGEREVPALEPGQENESGSQALTLPSDLPAGTYYLGACADSDNAVVELNESNNCETNKLNIFVPVEPSSNQPPDCTQAIPSNNTLWPPNHKLVLISISGITDPDGDPVAVTITGITQDEPVNGLGDGDTSPDGFGVGTSQSQIRAERSGKGNGRVYAISFTADDGKGGSCSGQVKVGVPHDQGKGKNPVDDGQNYDSTMQ